MAFGTGPFGLSPYGLAEAATEGELRGELHTSRAIDKFGRYEFDDETSSFKGMGDVHQRIFLLMSFEFKMPELKGRDFDSDISNRVRAALAPLTAGKDPVIRIKSVEPSWNQGSVNVIVKFHDYTTGQGDSIEL